MNTRTALLTLAIATSFAGVAMAREDASPTVEAETSAAAAEPVAPAAAPPTEADFRAALTAKGYTDVQDVKQDDGVWEAEAKNSAGKEVDVKLAAANGEVDEDDVEDAADKAKDANEEANEAKDDDADEKAEKH